jgi:hypothetical protein
MLLSSDPDQHYYEHQSDTITALSGLPYHQASPSVCDDEGCDCKYQDGKYVPIFEEEVYKVITALENTSLQHGNEFNFSTVPYSHQLSYAAIEEVQKNI